MSPRWPRPAQGASLKRPSRNLPFFLACVFPELTLSSGGRGGRKDTETQTLNQKQVCQPETTLGGEPGCDSAAGGQGRAGAAPGGCQCECLWGPVGALSILATPFWTMCTSARTRAVASTEYSRQEAGG